MSKADKTFSLKEIEQLVKNAYEVGFCDGIESNENSEVQEYIDANDFWNKNVKKWINDEITYVV
jgi:hypothetical protein